MTLCLQNIRLQIPPPESGAGFVDAMADDERAAAYRSSPPGQWSQSAHVYPHSHHGTPAHEYSGFSFAGQMPMEPSAFSSGVHQRPMPQQLQPLVMPQWPSMLNSQQHSSYQPVYAHSIQPLQPLSAGPLPTPVSATSTRSVSTPRKTLTDQDRKRMCQYAEEHPGSKQTEIGAIFGVERSTVSKVLRQKEKYLYQEDGSKSPVKRPKGRSPDIERALSVWARNQVKKGYPLTDELIRDKARAFVATTTTPESHVALSASWIEKFKLKNNLLGARSRKASLATDDLETGSNAASSAHTPNDTSPTSPPRLSPSPFDLHSQQSHESLKTESPDSYLDYGSRHAAYHSQSTTSLHSAFTDTAPSSFSPVPLSPTSPFFTPDSGTAPSPFVPHLTGRAILPASSEYSSHRPRSQTFPQLDQFMTSSGEPPTPKNATAPVLDSPMEESSDPIADIDATGNTTRPEDRVHLASPSDTMRPPPLPIHIVQQDKKRESTPGSPSPEEARQALQVVLSFFEQQPNGFLDLQESVTIGKLMEKLKLQSRSAS